MELHSSLCRKGFKGCGGSFFFRSREHPKPTHRPLSRSFLKLPYGILNIHHKEELLRGLWADPLASDPVRPQGIGRRLRALGLKAWPLCL